jgi:hypothetical protein
MKIGLGNAKLIEKSRKRLLKLLRELKEINDVATRGI